MCHPTDPTSATPPADTLPFLRAVRSDGGELPPQPARPSNIAAIDGLDEIRSMIGLVSLAAEGLPSPYAGEFTTTLELVHAKIGATLDALRRGSGQPLLEPVEA